MNYVNGTIVRACAGRDYNSYFVVVASDYQRFVYIADGKTRRLDKPKKKNIKHLQFTKTVIDLNGCSDKALRKRLREYVFGNLEAEENTNV